jgi:hypothetical protein
MNAENPPVIWLIDKNHWERANIRALLIEHGFQVEGFVSIFHAVAMLYREIVDKPDLIVLEHHGLVYKRPELDELVRLGAPVILLTGVFEDDRELLEKHRWAAVLRRPFSIGQVADLVLTHAKPHHGEFLDP